MQQILNSKKEERDENIKETELLSQEYNKLCEEFQQTQIEIQEEEKKSNEL